MVWSKALACSCAIALNCEESIEGTTVFYKSFDSKLRIF